MHTFTKIVEFEDFRYFCKYRDGEKCSEEDNKTSLCHRANKSTMDNCPIWAKFKNYRKVTNVEEGFGKGFRKGKFEV